MSKSPCRNTRHSHSNHSQAFQQPTSVVGLESIQRYEYWKQWILNEYPVSHGGSPLRFITEDLSTFKAVLRSLLTLDEGTRELAITQLSIHNSILRKNLVACYQQMKLEIQGGAK